MWCDRCVENVSVANDGTSAPCPRCSSDLEPFAATMSAWRSQLTVGSRQLSNDLRHAQRLVAEVRIVKPAVELTANCLPEPHEVDVETSRVPSPTRWSPMVRLGFGLSAIAYLGGAALLCGAAWAKQNAWWQYGWPLMLLGQTGVMAILVLQLEARWRTRDAWQVTTPECSRPSPR